MCAVLLPRAELALRDDTLAVAVNRPRCCQVNILHVVVTEDMKTQVGVIKEVRTINGAAFIIDDRHTIVTYTVEAQVHHKLAAAGVGKRDGKLATNSSAVQAIVITASDDDFRPLCTLFEVEQYVIISFFDVRTVESTSKVIRRRSPLHFKRTIHTGKRTCSRIIRYKKCKTIRIVATTQTVEVA